MSGTTTTSSIATIGGLAGTPTTTQVGAQANNPQMNQFLTLLVAELKNQDPTQPTDPTQFVAQLAQFSTVEQLTQSNTTLTTIAQSLSSSQALGQYANMIGDTVSATATTISVPSSGSPTAMTYNVTTPSLSNIQAQITNSSGTVVRTMAVSGTSGTLQFNGQDSNGNALPAGVYGISLVGNAAGGTSQSAGTLSTTGTVTGVTQGSAGSWLLQLQDGNTVNVSSVTGVS
jgi:flagellar basal-body rod modification protein FlgD